MRVVQKSERVSKAKVAPKSKQAISKAKEQASKKSETYIEHYRQSVLGYRKARKSNLSMIDSAKRIAIIYDHAVHKKPVKQIIKDHLLNYSTVRHILLQYSLYGRTDIRKFRQQLDAKKPEEAEPEAHMATIDTEQETRAMTIENTSQVVSIPQSTKAKGLTSIDEQKQMLINEL